MSTKTKRQPAEKLTEFFAASPTSVDETAGVIRGVRVLGLQSKNGRRYSRDAVTSAIGLYEGAKVNVDHASKSESERSYRSRIGILKSVVQESDGGLRADLHYNPKHELAEQLVWDAKNAPSNVGLSHNVLGRTKRDGSSVVVESIERVLSVDLVADPATTSSLFEQTETDTENETMDYAALTLDEVRKNRPDLVESIENASKSFAEQKAQADVDAAEVKRLRESLAAYEAKEALAAVDAEIDSLVKEHKLPTPVVTEGFKNVLRNAKDSAARTEFVKALAESLSKAPASGGKPVSKEQGLTEGVDSGITDAKSFAARLVA